MLWEVASRGASLKQVETLNTSLLTADCRVRGVRRTAAERRDLMQSTNGMYGNHAASRKGKYISSENPEVVSVKHESTKHVLKGNSKVPLHRLAFSCALSDYYTRYWGSRVPQLSEYCLPAKMKTKNIQQYTRRSEQNIIYVKTDIKETRKPHRRRTFHFAWLQRCLRRPLSATRRSPLP